MTKRVKRRNLTEQQAERKARTGSARMFPFNCVSMTKEIRSIASGTIAKLCGSPEYSVIELYVSDWVQWVLLQDVRRTWPTWQDCHDDYLAHLAGHFSLGESEGYGRKGERGDDVLCNEE